MNGFNYILSKQIAWASRNKIKLVGSQIKRGKHTYTSTLDDNLFGPLLKETKDEIEKGDGGELTSSANHSAKMCAVHSSSAIAVNIFQYWKNKNIPDLAYSLGFCRKDNKSARKIHFECKFKISNDFRHSPNIDVVIFNNINNRIKVLGIECKFSEAYTSRKHPGLKEKYLTKISKQWEDIPNLLKLAKTISPKDNKYKHLHPAQLIKHILGMKEAYGKSGFRLLYLWYGVIGEEGCRHRKEIKEFTKITKSDNIKFHSLSYQELIVKMNNQFYKGNEQYIDYLSNRYL